MEEKSIIFSSKMVKAILDGRKTQTRRIIKPQPKKVVNDWKMDAEVKDVVIYRNMPCILKESHGRNKRSMGELTPQKIKHRYQVGDSLWVREALLTTHVDWLRYKADNEILCAENETQRSWIWKRQIYTTIPSIHMPKWAARIWLEVTGIRVERVQDINNKDIRAEGAAEFGCTHHRLNFQLLWDSLNAKRGFGWDVNPWVWVIEFKKIEATAAEPVLNEIEGKRD